MNANRAREPKSRRQPIKAEDRVNVMVEFEVEPGREQDSRWAIYVYAPESQTGNAQRFIAVRVKGNRGEAVRAGATIAAAFWSAGTPAKLTVRNRRTGQWGEERTYPDVTPRHRS